MRLRAHCSCPAFQKNIILHIASLRKDQNSKFEVWYVNCFCTTAKLKNCKSNHGKSGTMCVNILTLKTNEKTKEREKHPLYSMELKS